MKVQKADEASFLLEENHDNESSDDKLVSDKTIENVSTVEQLNLKVLLTYLLSTQCLGPP